MQRKKPDWYKEGWNLDIKTQSWTEETEKQVDFIIRALHLRGGERILDLACGFGRHSLSLARRGFSVVGIDITPDYVLDANRQAEKEGLDAQFYRMDIRDVPYRAEFDAVLSMADGAIGYLENEEENLKIFDAVSHALRPGGKYLMDIMSGDYADTHFPCSLWEAGKSSLTLSRFEWDRESRILLYGQNDFAYGSLLTPPRFDTGDPIRLYTRGEMEEILHDREMTISQVYADFDGRLSDGKDIQMIICSQKVQ